MLGPVFLELKTMLSPFWSRPHQRSLGPKRLTQRPRLPGLPPPLVRYLILSGAGAEVRVRKQKIK